MLTTVCPPAASCQPSRRETVAANLMRLGCSAFAVRVAFGFDGTTVARIRRERGLPIELARDPAATKYGGNFEKKIGV